MIPYATSGQLKALDEKVDSVKEELQRDAKGYDFAGTFKELLDLMLGGKLITGKRYRMTDYVMTLTDASITFGNASAGHPFDLVLTAIANNRFDENCFALEHNDFDEYWHQGGANNLLSDWRIKYTFSESGRYAENASALPFIKLTVDYYEDEAEEPVEYEQEDIGFGYDVEPGAVIYIADDDDMASFSLPFEQYATLKVGDRFRTSYDDGDVVIKAINKDTGTRGKITQLKDEKNLCLDVDFKNLLIKGELIHSSLPATNLYYVFVNNTAQPEFDASLAGVMSDLHDVRVHSYPDGFGIMFSGNCNNIDIGPTSGRFHSCTNVCGVNGAYGINMYIAAADTVRFENAVKNIKLVAYSQQQFKNIVIGEGCEDITFNAKTLARDGRPSNRSSYLQSLEIGKYCKNIILGSSGSSTSGGISGKVKIGSFCEDITVAINSSCGLFNLSIGDLCKNVNITSKHAYSHDINIGKNSKNITLVPALNVGLENIDIGSDCDTISLTRTAVNVKIGDLCTQINVDGQMQYCTFGDACHYINLPNSDTRGTLYKNWIIGDHAQLITSSAIATVGASCNKTNACDVVIQPWTGFGRSVGSSIDLWDGPAGLFDSKACNSDRTSPALYIAPDDARNTVMYYYSKLTPTGKYMAVDGTTWNNI